MTITAALSWVLMTVLSAFWVLFFSNDGHHVTSFLTHASHNMTTLISLPLNRGLFLVLLKLSSLLRLPCQHSRAEWMLCDPWKRGHKEHAVSVPRSLETLILGPSCCVVRKLKPQQEALSRSFSPESLPTTPVHCQRGGWTGSGWDHPQPPSDATPRKTPENILLSSDNLQNSKENKVAVSQDIDN